MAIILLSVCVLLSVFVQPIVSSKPTIVTPSPLPSNTVQPTSTVTSTVTTPEPTSTATTVPPPPPTDKDFYARYKNGSVCVHMQAEFIINVTYMNNTEPKSFAYNLTNMTVVASDSDCTQENQKIIRLNFTDDLDMSHRLEFKFTLKDNTWKSDVIRYTFPVTSPPFPNSEEYQNITGNHTVRTKDVLFSADSNVDLGKAFNCKSEICYDFNNTVTDQLVNVTLHVSSLKVQAFQFDKDDEEFSDSMECTADGRGNKIVPIAVGAALAGLVIVVLIAYLIGRLKNRKQGSYETLS